MKREPKSAGDQAGVPPSELAAALPERQETVAPVENLEGQIEFDAELLGQPRPMSHKSSARKRLASRKISGS